MNGAINGVDPQLLSPEAKQQINQSVSPGEAQNNFASTLKSAIDEVNEAQNASDKKTEALANGETDNLHDVMITAQKASLTLETSVQIQNKAIDAYNKIMRMQI